MEKMYVLIYRIDQYPEEGGGLYYERFATKEQMELFANSKNESNENGKFIREFAGLIHYEIEVEAVSIVTKLKIK